MIQKPSSPLFPDPYQRLDRPRELPVAVVDEREQPPVLLVSPIRRIRGAFVLAVMGFSIGILVVILYSPMRNDFLAPGPLALSHAQILKNQGSQRCATCHGAGAESLTSWIQDAFSGGKHLDTNQSHLCLACHDKTIGRENALLAHGMSASSLHALTADKRTALGSQFQVSVDSSDSDFACSVCHREHHGMQFDLTAITDAKCQSCHVRAFDRFEGNHSDFQLASHRLDQRNILFDHATHSQKHFIQKGKTFACDDCHQAENDERSFSLKPYEAACAQCHNSTVVATGSSGVPLLNLPSIDREILMAQGIAVSYWPESNIGDFEGELAPLLVMLLSTDSELSQRFKDNQYRFDFLDLNPDDAQDVRFAGQIVTAIIDLAEELKIGGKQALLARLASQGIKHPTTNDVTGMLHGLSDTLIRDYANSILGPPADGNTRSQSNLLLHVAQLQLSYRPDDLLASNPLAGLFQTEVPRERQMASDSVGQSAAIADGGVVLPAGSETGSSLHKNNNAEEFPAGEGHAQNESTADRSFAFPQANSHGEILLDNPLAGRVVLSPQSVQPDDSGSSKQFSESNHPRQSEQTNAKQNSSNRSATVVDNYSQGKDKSYPPANPAGEMLIANPLASLLHTKRNQYETSDSIENLDSIRDLDIASPERQTANQPERLPAIESFLEQESKVVDTDLPAVSDITTSQWQFDASRVTIQYFPVGHADPFTQFWLELSAVSPSTSADSLVSVFRGPHGIGQCHTCHRSSETVTVDALPSWKADRFLNQGAAFTTFSHRPHLLLRDCASCHRVNHESESDIVSTRGQDFLPITKLDCANCHQQGQAANHCSHCHQYHQHGRPENKVNSRGVLAKEIEEFFSR